MFGALANLATKSSPIAGSYGGFYANPVGSDIFRKSPPPSPMQLILENMGTANACVRLNSQALARTPLRLFVVTKKGQRKPKMSIRGETKYVNKKDYARLLKSPETGGRINNAENVEEVTDHPVLDLLRNPGGKGEDALAMGQFSLLELNCAYCDVIGTGFWYTPRDGIGGTPTAIWPLPSQFVQQIPGGKDDPIVKEYLLAVSGNNYSYQPDEIVPFRMCDLYNPYLGGFSPLRAAIESQRTMRQALALTNSRIQNGGRPSAVWSPDQGPDGSNVGPIGPDVAARMRIAIRQQFAQGGDGQILIAPYAGALTPIAWPMNDIIDSARYLMTEKMIAYAFGVPSTKLNRSDANRASAESGDYSHAVDAILPRCHFFADTMNKFLIPMFDDSERLFLAFDSPIKDDATFELEQTRTGSQLGLTRVNEGRASLGQDPIEGPGGDVRWVPNNMVPVNDLGQIDPNFVTAMAAMKPAPPQKEDEQKPSNGKPNPKHAAQLRMLGYDDHRIAELTGATR